MASHCPACSGSLGMFLGMDHEGELAECRSCGHPVRSRTPACPQCGIEHPAGRRAPRAAVPLILAAVLGALGLALGQTAPERAPSSITSDSALPDIELVVTRPAESTPIVRDTTPEAVREPSNAPRPPAVAVTPADTTGLQTRWVSDWSNMRRGPSNDAPVVRVVPPGTMVRGTPSKWGWWAIQYRGETVGYIAGALLRPNRPPGAPARPPADS